MSSEGLAFVLPLVYCTRKAGACLSACRFREKIKKRKQAGRLDEASFESIAPRGGTVFRFAPLGLQAGGQRASPEQEPETNKSIASLQAGCMSVHSGRTGVSSIDAVGGDPADSGRAPARTAPVSGSRDSGLLAGAAATECHFADGVTCASHRGAAG